MDRAAIIPVVREPLIRVEGQFRLRICDAARRAEAKRDCPGWSWEQIVEATKEHDTGWSHNVVTDAGRRRLILLAWGSTAFDLFIHEATAPGNVRRNSLGFIYATQPQVIDPVTTGGFVDLDRPTLLQTRAGTFAAVGVSRNINIVGLVVNSSTSTDGHLNGIAAYTKLSSLVVQGAAQTADVTYRVTWSLD